jgi:hypothetical protein
MLDHGERALAELRVYRDKATAALSDRKKGRPQRATDFRELFPNSTT